MFYNILKRNHAKHEKCNAAIKQNQQGLGVAPSLRPSNMGGAHKFSAARPDQRSALAYIHRWSHCHNHYYESI